MHILVTDQLACPRCGPAFGLILLADQMVDRRVLEGSLACANCREHYPIVRGYGDLRPPPRDPLGPDEPLHPEESDSASRLAALLGVTEGPGLLLIVGPSARLVYPLVGRFEGIELVAAHPQIREDPELEGVSRLAISRSLPFLSGSVRGVILEGSGGEGLIPEAGRVLVRGARLVYLDPPQGVRDRLQDRGIELSMESDTVLMGVRK